MGKPDSSEMLSRLLKHWNVRAVGGLVICAYALVVLRRWLQARRKLLLLKILSDLQASEPAMHKQLALLTHDELVSAVLVDEGGGFNSLHLSAMVGDARSMVFLLQHCPELLLTMVDDRPGVLPIHCAATQGSADCIKLLLDAQDYCTRGIVRELANQQDGQGVTPLMTVANRGHLEGFQLLVDVPNIDVAARDKGGRNALHYAVMACLHDDRVAEGVAMASALLGKHPALARDRDTNGLTPLMIAAQINCASLEAASAAVTAVDGFGQTALHLAIRHGLAAVVPALAASSTARSCRDDDGDFPIHTAFKCGLEQNQTVAVARALLELDDSQANAIDFSDAAALHAVSRAGRHGEDWQCACAELLLEHEAFVGQLDESGWSSIHYVRAYNEECVVNPGKRLLALLEAAATEVELGAAPERAEMTQYLSRRGPQPRLAASDREAVVGGKTGLEAIAHRLLQLGSKARVIVMCGAGISTASGIPDYRSETGLYAAKGLNKSDMFRDFYNMPNEFWRMAHELFAPGKFQPCLTHSFLRLLERRKMLLRCYTQNIDGLELQAGVSQDKLVQCHGSFSSARCTQCHAAATNMNRVWQHAAEAKAAPCELAYNCQGVMRPDVVFFGESLPARVAELRVEDFEQCNLLIVLGTSLKVYPFAGYVNDVPVLSPRLLVNNQAVGPWDVHKQNPNSYRDVKCIGQCDEGLAELAGLMGCGDELEQLVANAQNGLF